ncbi:MAG: hypothetical protein LRY25_00865 [Flavobacterium sp.]|nr:hypothetical protein [Flavobacterium sp.]
MAVSLGLQYGISYRITLTDACGYSEQEDIAKDVAPFQPEIVCDNTAKDTHVFFMM